MFGEITNWLSAIGLNEKINQKCQTKVFSHNQTTNYVLQRKWVVLVIGVFSCVEYGKYIIGIMYKPLPMVKYRFVERDF